MGRGREGKGREREEEGKGGEGCPPIGESGSASDSMSTGLQMPASVRSVVPRVDDHSSVGNFNTSPCAVC